MRSVTLIDDLGVAEDHDEDPDGYTVNFVTVPRYRDLARAAGSSLNDKLRSKWQGGPQMDSAWLDDYIAAWKLHPLAGSPEGHGALKQLLTFLTPSIRYEDVPTGNVYVGHDGITKMSNETHKWAPDLTFKVVTRQTDGSLYAFESEATGTNTSAVGSMPATGRPFMIRLVSVGTVSSGGLVGEHRDYWDLAGFLKQIGAMTTPS
jgi:hypothetical protein